MQLRPYEPKDWPRLCEIHDSARMDELRASGLTDAFLPLEQAAENEGLFDYTLAVAEVEGSVQGFVAYSDTELTWLYVDPTAYRKGIGRQLLRHAIQASNCPLFIEVLVGNDAALALYLAEGFHIVKIANGMLAGNEQYAASCYVLERAES